MRRKQTNEDKNYLDIIFDNNDYESPEEKAIRSVETLPSIALIDSAERSEREKI